jgi:hypothetical protein
VHFLGSSGVAPSQWNAQSQVVGETFYDFTGGDVDGNYLPLFNARVGRNLGSVRVDYYGNPRPTSGARNVGAVESH